jgi:thermostable 8-oxoguanine DNA glycosylase
MRDPETHYDEHRPVYDHISEQVEQTTQAFAEAPRQEQAVMLNKAVTFALISAQTQVRNHEAGYLNAIQATDPDEIREGLLDGGVNYYKNKAGYILHNISEADYDRILDHYDDGEIDAMHRAIADECKGVSLRKAAFAMAKVVTTDKGCLDTHVAQQAGIEPDEIYNGVVVDKYEQQWDQIEAQWPDLSERLGRFMFQWVLFDSHMDCVTTHDVWFESMRPHAQVGTI